MGRSLRAGALVSLLLAACGGDSFETAEGQSAGAAGASTAGSSAAGSATAGSGTAGSGTAGSATAGSGTAGSGVAGSSTAGSGTAGSATAGSSTAGSGAAGKAGSATAGSGAAGSGAAGKAGSATAGSGTAGAAGCSCPAPSSPCEIVTCDKNVCGTAPNPNPVLEQPPHDCRKQVCTGTQLTSVADDTDTPSGLGPCDQPSCEGGTPKHVDLPNKCAVGDACMGGKCLCKSCVNGKFVSFPNVCRAWGSATANATVGATPENAVDGNVATLWKVPVLTTSASINVMYGGLVDARTIVVVVDTDNPIGTSSNISIHVVASDADGTDFDLGTQMLDLPDGQTAVKFPLNPGQQILYMVVDLQSTETQLAIADIGYQSCP